MNHRPRLSTNEIRLPVILRFGLGSRRSPASTLDNAHQSQEMSTTALAGVVSTPLSTSAQLRVKSDQLVALVSRRPRSSASRP